MYYIYILFSLKTNKYYIGSTDDLARRLKHHNAGSTPSTKGGAPDWVIRYTETVTDSPTAFKRELEIKRQELHRKVDPKRKYPIKIESTFLSKKLTTPALLRIGVYHLF
jgi:putative endonuclease